MSKQGHRSTQAYTYALSSILRVASSGRCSDYSALGLVSCFEDKRPLAEAVGSAATI